MGDCNTLTGLPEMSRPARVVRWLLLHWYVRSGWQAVGTLPPDRKFIIIGAPHTSNWDFPVFLGTVHAVGREVRFIGKHSLFKGAVGRFMRALGGVPVNRAIPQDTVSQIVDQIAASDDFLLIVAAEGTRSRTTKWKTGFYQIALKAKVPIVCAGPDYPNKRGIFGPVIHPTGYYDRDMAPAFAFFRTLSPRHPERSAFPGDAG